MPKVGLIGLGVMGYRIGINLAKAGLLEVVYNRTIDKAKQFSNEFNIPYVENPAELAKRSDIIITMLSDDSAVSSVVLTILDVIKGKVLVDMSTISPTVSIDLAKKVSDRGGVMFDAPVIGTSVMLESKKAVILVGGPSEKFNEIKDVLYAISNTVVYFGENGMGLYAKLVNNLLLGVYVAALGEAYNFGIKAGLKKEQVAKVLMELSSARSPTSELKLPKIVSEDYTTQFATKHMRKDLEIIERESQKLRAVIPLAVSSLQFYKIAEALGYSEQDFASVAEVFKRLSPR
ncbi:MAG: NAD(P)-dependent oxidoreductase [Sulfolobaceae archaeon]|nr:NAD(P)-dependent oxidoreductase [Sulfolobaceae archaeon]